MTNFVEATVKNPRWWMAMPFMLFVILPLVLLQLALRLLALGARTLDTQLEILGHALLRAVRAWQGKNMRPHPSTTHGSRLAR